ncbi:hypothetical protein CRI85_02470 [Leuconostoc pseudomesenteroides]|uniref:hypothetical protein n=1 Tax=Leuconostoc pseudomesenteroides TaxID=33968 RepID=UPI001E532951|nr:hypothetical protein [Leuconostoc pseudomesenteroides]MCC8439213.1 hypothetical protein [Leuconostoc pseudomesenteroides]
MGIFKSIDDLLKDAIEITEIINNNANLQKIINSEPEIKDKFADRQNLSKKFILGRKIVSISKYIYSFFLILIVSALIFLLSHFVSQTHLHGFGAKQFSGFDWSSLLINLSQTAMITLVVVEILLFLNSLIENWINEFKIRTFLRNFGYMVLLLFTVGSIVISFTLAMNSDQLSITASVIAFFAIFEFAFRKPFHNFVSLSTHFYQRIQNKVFNHNKQNK